MTKPRGNWQTETKLWQVAILRIFFGYYFFQDGLGKLTGSFTGPGMLEKWLTTKATGAFSWYKPFLTGVVIPYHQLFAGLIAWGMILAGLALLFGLLTRPAALAGIFMTLNFYLAKGGGSPATTSDQAFMAGLLVVFLTRAGRSFGLDCWLARRYPGSPLW
ncbi:MAG: DoxX family membrane protein [candidate division NC10 bacterium]|nr:DoxX family membrane protein [candidate division NC10 bacterium]MDE2321543.1 DoxX family membrane protein [candidate division NC10 bacterium]